MDKIDLTKEFEKKVEKKKSKDYGKLIKLYVIPIGALIFFIGFMLLFVTDKVVTLLSDLDKISTLSNQYNQKRQELNEANILMAQRELLNQKLEIVNSIAPSGETEIVNFRDRVSQLAENNGLTIISQRNSETDSSVPKDSQVINQQALLLQEIAVNYEVAGAFANVESFIEDLSNLDDFVIIKDMNLSKGTDNNWTLTLNFIKYQFKDDEELDKVYRNVSPGLPLDPAIEEYITERSGARQI